MNLYSLLLVASGSVCAICLALEACMHEQLQESSKEYIMMLLQDSQLWGCCGIYLLRARLGVSAQ